MTQPIKMLVKKTFTDLRQEPSSGKLVYEKDPSQSSQLLFGEPLLVHAQKGEWLFIEAIQQQKYYLTGEWKGYEGWIKKAHAIEVSEFPIYNLVISGLWTQIYTTPNAMSSPLSPVCLGTKLQGKVFDDYWWHVSLSEEIEGFVLQKHAIPFKPRPFKTSQDSIIDLGEKLLNHPYHWGGLTIFKEDFQEGLTSLDCSGLVYLLYRVYGLNIPRDAHDQFLISKKLEPWEMQIGDLIFIKYHQQSDRIGHVMLYAEGDEILDANITDRCVVKTTLSARYGFSLNQLKSGDDIGKRIIFFGSIR
jgi:gamma-D-glutamyl-L-lysine dipeptidyl-peptidase